MYLLVVGPNVQHYDTPFASNYFCNEIHFQHQKWVPVVTVGMQKPSANTPRPDTCARVTDAETAKHRSPTVESRPQQWQATSSGTVSLRTYNQCVALSMNTFAWIESPE